MPENKAIPQGYMTVGEIAKKMNTTVRTLQYYDKEGLLPPSAGSKGGRRLYSHKDVVRLHQIQSMKYLGFSLDDIKNRLVSLETLGAAIGMLAKNQQAATAIGMPIAMVIGFTPMIASFNKTVEKAASILYTQQLNIIVNDFSANFAKALTVIGLNILVFVLIFTIAYKKKGLKG